MLRYKHGVWVATTTVAPLTTGPATLHCLFLQYGAAHTLRMEQCSEELLVGDACMLVYYDLFFYTLSFSKMPKTRRPTTAYWDTPTELLGTHNGNSR